MAYRLVAHVQLVKHQRRILADVRVRTVEINSAVSAPNEGIGFAGTCLSIHNCSLAMYAPFGHFDNIGEQVLRKINSSNVGKTVDGNGNQNGVFGKKF